MPVSRPNLIVCLGLTLLLGACGEKETIESQRPRVVVQVAETNDYAAAATLTGDIQARVQTELSFRVGGKIISRSVDVGDRVTAKQVLARLDPKDLQTDVDSAAAQVFAEQARVTQASTAFARQQKLLPKGYTSQSEYDTAEAALLSSRSALKAAEAQLANAREQLSYAALVADAPGIITARQAEVGQVVQATMPIFSLAVDGPRDAVFNVYESLSVDPRNDRRVTVRMVDNPQVQASGRVREVNPTVSAQSGTVQVKVGLDSTPKGMELGSVVSASVNAAGKTSVELPWAALTKALHDPAVWVVDKDGKVNLQLVTVSRYLTGKVVISEGLKGGETVVVAGGQTLHPGAVVEVAPASAEGVTP